MTKKDKQTLSDMNSINRFMVNVAADPRGYETTQMTIRAFYGIYRRFCRNNKLKGCLSLQEFSGQLPDYGIRGVVRDASATFSMPDMSQLRESLMADLGLNRKFFEDDESLRSAVGERSIGLVGDWSP